MVFGLKFLVILIAIILGVALSIHFVPSEGRGKGPQMTVRPWGIGAGFVVFLLAIFLVLSVGQIEAGNLGVVLNLGAVTGEVKRPGPYVITPFTASIEIMDTQTHAYEANASAASNDLQDVNTTVTLNYSLNAERAAEIYQNLRRDYVERVMKPAVQESVKATTALFNAEALITERAKVKAAIQENLTQRLATYGILVQAVSITDFKFSPVFAQAVEAKVAAAQRALEAENKLKQIEVEARQAKQAAEGRASAAIAEASGQATAILTVAEAQARANKLVNETLTDAVIRYQLVQKLGPDLKVIVLPAGQSFILGPDVLGGKP